MPYRTLDRYKITKTAESLEARIAERFPQSSLRNVAREQVPSLVPSLTWLAQIFKTLAYFIMLFILETACMTCRS